MFTDAPAPGLIGQITLAAAALERAINLRLVHCLPELSVERQTIVLSRLTFRQRLDIVHELTLASIAGEKRDDVTAWRRRVAKAWAQGERFVSRARFHEASFDETVAMRALHRLKKVCEATQQLALDKEPSTLPS